MASGFLLNEMLAEAFRKPYNQGDKNITILYLVEQLKMGPYRVMLKSNFDTACWVPPAGKRDSHSIYYGDRMLARVIEKFCKEQSIEVPKLETFVADVSKKLTEKRDRELAKAAAAAAKARRGKPASPPAAPTAPVKPTKAQLFNAQIEWLKNTLPSAKWETLSEWLVQAVASYGRHERQHARMTPQDLKQVKRDLRTLGIPFMLFNLFEDARIEHSSREELGDPFQWMMFEDLAPMRDPVALFLRCIQLEGAPDTEALSTEAPFGKDGKRVLSEAAEAIQGFYRRTCKATTAEQMYPIITAFIEEFKDELQIPPPEEGAGEGSGGTGAGSSAASGSGEGEGEGEGGDDSGAEERAGDLSTAAEAAERGDEFFDEFDADAEVVGGTDEEGRKAEEEAREKLKGSHSIEPPKGKGGKSQGIPECIVPQESGGMAEEHHFLAKKPGNLDATYAARVEKLTAVLLRMFKAHTLPAATENPGKRLSSRHLARGELKFVHRKVFGGKSRRKYTIVYDCSGSMSGRPDREGKLFLLALNNLAKRGFLQGSLILSGWVNGRPGWLKYTFPLNDAVILRIQPSHSSEGIQDALKDNLKELNDNDDVFVYTDACICDAPLDRGFFAKRKIWPVGLYVGDDDAASEMERHFPQSIIRSNIEELVEKLVTRNRRTVG